MDGLSASVSGQNPKQPLSRGRPLCPATSKFKPGTDTVKQGTSVMAGEVVTQRRMWKWSPQ